MGDGSGEMGAGSGGLGEWELKDRPQIYPLSTIHYPRPPKA